jgi:hypothetical protein
MTRARCFYQQEKWLEEYASPTCTQDSSESNEKSVAASASRSRIQHREPDEDKTTSINETDVKWKYISGRAIVSGERLQEKLDRAVSCPFSQRSIWNTSTPRAAWVYFCYILHDPSLESIKIKLTWRLRAIISLQVRRHPKYIFLFFAKWKLWTVEHTFPTFPSQQPLSQFRSNFSRLLTDRHSTKPYPRILIPLFI